jgi:hypothetical protein
MHEITRGYELYLLKWAVHSGEFEAMLKSVGSFKVKNFQLLTSPILIFLFFHQPAPMEEPLKGVCKESEPEPRRESTPVLLSRTVTFSNLAWQNSR